VIFTSNKKQIIIPGVSNENHIIIEQGIQESEEVYLSIPEEEEKMKLFVKELNLHGLEIKIVCLYGKEGWEASNFARANNADVFAVSGPAKKVRFIDRLFPHEVEYSFEKLPSNLLIIK